MKQHDLTATTYNQCVIHLINGLLFLLHAPIRGGRSFLSGNFQKKKLVKVPSFDLSICTARS